MARKRRGLAALVDWLFGGPELRKLARGTRRGRGGQRGSAAPKRKGTRAGAARGAAERQRSARVANTERRRYETGLLRQAARAERTHTREVQQLKRQGWSDAEIKQLLDERHVWDNPRKRRRR